MIIYLLKSAACLALLLFFYHLVLEKEKMHNFNRFYLLTGVIASFLIPLATITTYVKPIVEPIVNEASQTFTNTTSIDNSAIIIQEDPINYTQIAIYFYAFITLVLLVRFGVNLFKIIRKTRIYKTVMHQKAKLVLVDDKILPHTFWNYIFINKEDYQNKKIEQELFTHELTHVTQKHTLDVLLIELLQVIFWINPLFIFIKKAIQLNHEFLADETVINQYKNTFQYQHLLLNKAAWKNEYYLASNLNYSLTKKRLTMMTTQSSPTRILLKKLAVIPLLTGFVLLFAQRVEAQEKQEIKEEVIEEIVEDVPFNKEDLSKSEIYKEYFNSKLTFTFKDKNGNKISKKYNELTTEEKKRVIPPPPLKSKKKIPTQKLIEKLKNGKKYAIWIDGKVVKNEDLNNYKASDFSNHFVSFVYKNARSKRFPQENQAHLSTHKYFKAENDKRVRKFKDFLKKKYDIKEIEVIKSPTKEKKKNTKKYNLPSSKSSKQSISNTQSISEVEKLIKQLELSYLKDENLERYNTLAKKYNAIPIEKRIIPLKDLNTLETLYKKFSKKEKAIAQPFPECYLPNKVSSSLEKYNKINNQYENYRNKKPHFLKSSKPRQKELSNLFSKLGSMYFNLSKENKRKAKRPIHPHHPYVKLMKNNKVFYKLKKELTEEDKLLFPPPPLKPDATKEEILRFDKAHKEWMKRSGNTFKKLPPPPKRNHLDQVIKMAKKGAKFYYEKKPISSDKAIRMLKANKKLSIHSESTNNSNFKVWISKKTIKN